MPEPKPAAVVVETPPQPPPMKPVVIVPPAEDDPAKLAKDFAGASGAKAAEMLKHLRESKGASFTKALVLGIGQLDGPRKSEAREALAERLTRMTADTLREMLRNDEPELRRAAALACAMKDDKDHVPDLIDRLTDEDVVARAAKAGLKSLTGQDFGPEPDATAERRKAAAEAWRAWWAKQKK